MERFNNKICIITGATNGIGFQMGNDFMNEGAIVYNLDIEKPKKSTHSEFEEIHYIHCDLRSEVQIRKSIEQILNEVGKIDFLINNACFSNKGLISNCSSDEFNDVLKVGVTAPYLLTLGFMAHFNEDGCIINIASTRGFMSQRDTESYSAAKGGILALTHAMSISLAGMVRVNSISPGWINTSENAFDKHDHRQHPVKRIGVPRDISNMAMFLCSSEASFITGENIIVDGGMTKQMIYHGEESWCFEEK